MLEPCKELSDSHAVYPIRWWMVVLVAILMAASTPCGVIGAGTAEAALDDESAESTVEPIQLPKAAIVGYTPVSSINVLDGAQASFGVTVTNTGAISGQFVVVATVWNAEGIVVGVLNTVLSSPLQPTKQATVS